MITITIPFLTDMGACQESIDWTANHFQQVGITQCTWQYGIDQIKPYCDANPTITVGWMNWYDSLPTNPKAIMYFPDWKYLDEFKLQNLITNTYDYFTSLSDAQAQLELNKQEYIVNQKERFSVNIDIDNPDGSITWTPVDPFSFDQEDDYQVFDTFTGQYTACSNLADAKAAQKSIEEQVGNLVPPIQQKISSADGQQTAWIGI